jgi:diacylglycerol kinase (ATP)
VRRVRITADVPVMYQLDGDPGGFLPLDIEILPQRLTMLVPTEQC